MKKIILFFILFFLNITFINAEYKTFKIKNDKDIVNELIYFLYEANFRYN